MKALSLYQPWATFVAIGLKNFETRSWQTGHRGELAIHASKKLDPAGRALYARVQALLLPGLPLPPWADLPRGCVLCVCLLRDVYRTEDALESGEVGVIERELGNYAAGRFAWLLTVTKTLKPPMPATGRQMIFNVDL